MEAAAPLAEGLVDRAYVRDGATALHQHSQAVKSLLAQRRLPADGWSDAAIELLLHELALMDSQNFIDNVGVGEREARVASRLVAQRHYRVPLRRLAHGVGRSGDIAATQPKAAGSSIMAKLTEYFVLQTLQLAGATPALLAGGCVVLPLATGMAMLMVLLAVRAVRPPTAKVVLWPRIDQKSCLKAIVSAGFELVVVPNRRDGDEVTTNVEWMAEYIAAHGADSVAAVVTTTSCFAPRIPDRLAEVAQLCKQHGLPHVVNNAYGVQSTKCMHLLSEAARLGRLDAFVQSTDKNYLVPVGGAVVAGPDKAFVRRIAQAYPGRASNAPMVDLFITLLSLGTRGYEALLRQRRADVAYLRAQLTELAQRHGLALLSTPRNDISMALSLEGLALPADKLTFLGSMLFTRRVSGARVVPRTGKVSEPVPGLPLVNFGAHLDDYPASYLTAAAALGVTRRDIDEFVRRLDACLTQLRAPGNA